MYDIGRYMAEKQEGRKQRGWTNDGTALDESKLMISIDIKVEWRDATYARSSAFKWNPIGYA